MLHGCGIWEATALAVRSVPACTRLYTPLLTTRQGLPLPAVRCSQHVALEAVRQGRQWVTDQVGWAGPGLVGAGLLDGMGGFRRHAAVRDGLLAAWVAFVKCCSEAYTATFHTISTAIQQRRILCLCPQVKGLVSNREALVDALSPLGQENVVGGEGAIYLFAKLPEGAHLFQGAWVGGEAALRRSVVGRRGSHLAGC